MVHPASPPVALTIAGSDNSAGAGAQADLKTFMAHRVYGLTALTCVVAEVPGRVSRIAAVAPEVVGEQIRLSLAAYPVAAIKTGMLHSREVIELVAEIYGGLTGAARSPLVVDPVMVASSGARLLPSEAVAAYAARLFPLATLVTPNLDEARVLLGAAEISTLAAMRDAGRELSARFGTSFLMKGGHFGGEEAIDWLCTADGSALELRAPFTRNLSTHGTGCTYSAAVTAGLASGLVLEAAVENAKIYISAAIAEFFRWEKTGVRVDALNHWPPCGPGCSAL
jgi:hydroxymethylpyrimidine/phosphomethylpyrimidine kinase